MADLTPYDFNQLFPISAHMNLVVEQEKIENQASLEEWVSQLLHARNFQRLCPLPYKGAGIWNKLPCGVEIETTLNKGIVIDYVQESELYRRLLHFWGLSLSHDVFSELGRRAVYDALFPLLSYVDQLSANSPSEVSVVTGSDLPGTLQKHWRQEYIGPSCGSLRDKIREYEVISKENKHYSKSLLFVQSSGTGKSRLADKYGKFCPMVTYVLRNDESGFPPPDKVILDAMCDSTNYTISKGSPGVKSYDESAEEKKNLTIHFHAVSIGIQRYESFFRETHCFCS